MKTTRLLVVLGVMAMFGAPLTAQTQQPTSSEKTPGVDARQKVQRERIKEGMKSGELTKPEAKKLAREQKRINRQEAKAKGDGEVTKKERVELQRKQNRSSRHIAKQKHDRQDKN